jgi:protein gp37
MSDLFHRDVPDEYIRSVADVMLEGSWHIYQVLTKRSERLRDVLRGYLRVAANAGHIWWGVSVENRRHGLPRIDHLRDSGAKIKFLSIEPLLEDIGVLNLTGIDWVIVGGESGPKARPMRGEWVESLRDQCTASGVAFFFKQWGGVQKKRAGRMLDGRTWDEMPDQSAATPGGTPTRMLNRENGLTT